MITGTFDENGRPYVQGRLVIPRLKLDWHVDFLVDTGADSSCLHPQDSIPLSVPYHRLRNAIDCGGIGGKQVYYGERAIIIFTDGSRLRLHVVTLSIAKPNEQNMVLPSLLGQDILQSWHMRHYKPSERLDFIVKRCDLTIDHDSIPTNFYPEKS